LRTEDRNISKLFERHGQTMDFVPCALIRSHFSPQWPLLDVVIRLFEDQWVSGTLRSGLQTKIQKMFDSKYPSDWDSGLKNRPLAVVK
jgi:hypothetical protein